jgi:predicted DNA-binding protein YlxM (UPF0122 family)
LTTAQQLVDGLLSPTQVSERTPGYQTILQYAQQYSQQKYGKPFSFQEAEQNYQAKQKALDQNATTIRQIVNSQQTALSHLGELESIAKKVNFSDLPAANEARIFASDHVKSDANIKELQSTINIIRGEVAKVLGGGTATVEALTEAQNILPFNISNTQLKTVIDRVKSLMQEKINAYSNLNNIPQFGSNPSSGSNVDLSQLNFSF